MRKKLGWRNFVLKSFRFQMIKYNYRVVIFCYLSFYFLRTFRDWKKTVTLRVKNGWSFSMA